MINAHTYNQSNQPTQQTPQKSPQARFDAAGEGTPIPKPPHWGGYRLVPDRVEFWKGRQSRLHDRIVYTLEKGGDSWAMQRLQP